LKLFSTISDSLCCHDTQHNDIQHNDIQHNDIQHNNIQQNNALPLGCELIGLFVSDEEKKVSKH
jgi:hypothetical protein